MFDSMKLAMHSGTLSCSLSSTAVIPMAMKSFSMSLTYSARRSFAFFITAILSRLSAIFSYSSSSSTFIAKSSVRSPWTEYSVSLLSNFSM